jgi:hypothetical protein
MIKTISKKIVREISKILLLIVLWFFISILSQSRPLSYFWDLLNEIGGNKLQIFFHTFIMIAVSQVIIRKFEKNNI